MKAIQSRGLRLSANIPLPGVLKRQSYFFSLVFSLILICLVAAAPAAAQTETVLYSFCQLQYCADGTTPQPGLVLDSAGNLFGAAAGGSGSFYGGVVFEVSTKKVESLVFEFNAINQGVAPNGGLVRDSNGNFYGSTAGGGWDGPKCHKYFGCGLVYKLSGGNEQVLYSFQGGTDTQEPNGGLILDSSGNLYGTSYHGGGSGSSRPGTVFKVSPGGSETVLHRFGGSKDGKLPTSGLVMDKKRNVYGTTSEGGSKGDYGPGYPCIDGCGTVYEITAAGAEQVLYQFTGSKSGDGAAPFSSLIMDAKGNLYGTTYAGGTYGFGTVYKLAPNGQETVLYSFAGQPDASNPVGRLLLDSKGNLFGSTSYGGKYGTGAVFKLSASGAETVLYSFSGGADGAYPFDGLTMDSSGNLYGTTQLGGNFGNSCPLGCGVVFKLTQQ